MKVDLAALREAKRVLAAYPAVFCDYCGETDPPSGFYPLAIGGTGSISGVICNDCANTRSEDPGGVVQREDS